MIVTPRWCTSKDRQANDQKKKDERINNDLQNTTKKTKDRVTHIELLVHPLYETIFVTRVKRRVPQMEHELLILPGT